jgi:hypothetical protein
VYEHIFAAIFTLDEAEALLAVKEFYDALTGADNLGRHSAATTTAATWAAEAATAATWATAEAAATAAAEAATITAAEAAAISATTKAATITAAEAATVSAAKAAAITAAETATIAITATRAAKVAATAERIFAKSVPLVPSAPTAPFVKTHALLITFARPETSPSPMPDDGHRDSADLRSNRYNSKL